MICVIDRDDEPHEYELGRFYTDEHNNLCIEDSQERLIAVFAEGKWAKASWDAD